MQHANEKARVRSNGHISNNMPPVVKINNHHYMSSKIDSTKPSSNKHSSPITAVAHSSGVQPAVTSPVSPHMASATVPYKPPPSPTLNSHSNIINNKPKNAMMMMATTNDMPHPVPPPPPQPTQPPVVSSPQLATIHKRVFSSPVAVESVNDATTNGRVEKSSKSRSRQNGGGGSSGGGGGALIERRSTHLGTGKQSIRSSKRFVINSLLIFFNAFT